MNALRRLWRLRREDGRVKLALLFLLAALALLGYAASGALEYAALLEQPVEYVLAAAESGAALDAALRRLVESGGAVGASRQREYSVSAGEKTLAVTELDGAYLAACYGIEANGEVKRFWLGSAAFSSFCGSKAESPAQIAFEIGDKSETGAFYAAGSLPEGLAVARGTTKTLSGSASARVMFAKTDPSGADAVLLQSMGFSVVNREELVRRSYEAELLLTRLGFSLLSAAFAGMLARLYWKTRTVR